MEASNETPKVTTAAPAKMDFIKGPEASRQFAELLNTCFGLKEGQNFLDDFPVWAMDDHPRVFRVGVYKEGRLVASSCARVTYIKTGLSILPVAVIGAVATHPDERGHGYASKLVAMCNEWATEHGCALSLLWGSEFELYRRLGFDLCGTQAVIKGLGLGIREVSGDRGLGYQCGFTSGIFQQLLSRKDGLVVEPFDEKWIAAHKNVQWFWTGTEKNPDAYLAMGRGIDLQDLIHEWGGSPAALRELLGAVVRDYPGVSILGSRELFKRAGIFFDDATTQYLCLAKVLDPRRLITSYLPLAQVEATPWPSPQEKTWELKINGKGIFLRDSDLPKFFFGPEKNIPGFDHLFPLPLWIWGLDAA